MNADAGEARASPIGRRIQLSLYVSSAERALLESVRQLLDPIQARLIPAHVTLCREDELVDVAPALLRARLERAGAVTLRFGPPEPFHGHGVLLPCVAGDDDFQALRRCVLGGGAVRRHAPHITLAHPRNPKASSNLAANVALLPGDLAFTFSSVCRIEQVGMQPWQVLDEFELAPSAPSSTRPEATSKR